MRLLRVIREEAGAAIDITLCEYTGSKSIPKYAILSHRWRDEEVLFSDFNELGKCIRKDKKGFSKLEGSCKEALKWRVEHVWLDTACIDKSSSAELSEAINSMYQWYESSSVCFAYLDDVECDEDDPEATPLNSSWFSRGWTLQELIAPRRLLFVSKTWKHLGNRNTRCGEVKALTKVPKALLKDNHLSTLQDYTVSRRLSWAAQRETTRDEDEAYSLMGLFGVSMAALYGEGRVRAFRRLQLEIMAITNDHTLFIWDNVMNGDMLAPYVSYFTGAQFKRHTIQEDEVELSSKEEFALKPDYVMTNTGLHIQLPLFDVPKFPHLTFALLSCKETKTGKRAAICLQKWETGTDIGGYHRTAFCGQSIYLFSRTELDGRQFYRRIIWVGRNPYSSLDPADHLAPLNFIRPLFAEPLKFTLRLPEVVKRSSDLFPAPLFFGHKYSTILDGILEWQDFQYQWNSFYLRDRAVDVVLGFLNNKLWLYIGTCPHRSHDAPDLFFRPFSGRIWKNPRNICFLDGRSFLERSLEWNPSDKGYSEHLHFGLDNRGGILWCDVLYNPGTTLSALQISFINDPTKLENILDWGGAEYESF